MVRQDDRRARGADCVANFREHLQRPFRAPPNLVTVLGSGVAPALQIATLQTGLPFTGAVAEPPGAPDGLIQDSPLTLQLAKWPKRGPDDIHQIDIRLSLDGG